MDPATLLGFFWLILFMFVPCTLSNQSLFSRDSVFECGNITARFPFWGADRGDPCGHPYLKLSCDRVSNKTSLTFPNVSYDVHQIDNKLNTLYTCQAKFFFNIILLHDYISHKVYDGVCEPINTSDVYRYGVSK